MQCSLCRDHSYENVSLITPVSETHDVFSTQISSDDQLHHQMHLGHCGNNKNIDRKSLSTNDLLYWSFQIAKGMTFLASKKVCLI